MGQERRKLRVAVLSDGHSVPSWAFKMLVEVASLESCDIVLHVLNGSKAENKQSLLSKVWHKKAHLLYFIYETIDKKLFSVKPDAFAKKNLNEILQNVPQLVVTPIQKKYSDWFHDEDIQKIRRHEPDVLIRLGFRILKGEILNVAKHGVWSYHHADNRVNRGGPAGFWEFVRNEGVTGITLQKLTESLDNGVVISRSGTSTNRFSYSRNRNQLYWRSCYMLPRKMDQLALSNPKSFWNAVDVEYGDNQKVGALYKTPKNWEFIKWMTPKTMSVLAGRIMSLFRVKQWILLYKFSHNEPRTKNFNEFLRLEPNRKLIWADPFPVVRNGITAVFFEEQPIDSELGYIVCSTFKKNGSWSEPKKVIDTPHHTSFPFVFEYENDLFMIPEMGRSRKTTIYKCFDFPFVWKPITTILGGVVCMDTVLIEHDGSWFLFTTVVEPDGSSSWDELHLYVANNPLTGDWKPHPKSPIVTDPTKARMAGNFYVKEGRLYRPSQNCSGHYGAGMTINTVDVLSAIDYQETVVDIITPDWSKDLIGTHTYNFTDGLTLIDGQKLCWRWF